MLGASAPASAGAHRPDIDGLRAIAVVSVIISHIDARLLPSGYLGVDVFFVLSGFVITASLMRYEHDTLGAFILSFYQRRVKRLVPALAFFVLVTATVITLIDEFPRSALITGAASMLGLSNIYLVRGAVDYFSPSTELNAFVHTWSLGVEEQFYLLFPLLFWMTIGRAKTSAARAAFVWLMGILSVASLIGFGLLYQTHQPQAYFLMPTRFWELGVGALTYACIVSRSAVITRVRRLSPGLVLCILLAVFFSPTNIAVSNTIAVVLLTGLLVMTLRPNTVAFAVLTTRFAVFLGLISYSLYLWHWGVLTVARLTIGVSLATLPLLVVAMVGLATLSYYLIERPLRYAQWSAEPGPTIAKGLAASVLCTGLVLGLLSLQPRINLANTLGYDISHVTLTWWEDRRSGTYLEICHPQRAYDPALIDQCLPDERTGPRAFLLGDSHARNYFATLQATFTEHTVSYLTMGYNCAYLPMSLSTASASTGCADYVRDSTARIASLVHAGDIVVIGQRLWSNPNRESDAYMAFLAARARPFIASGARVVLLDSVVPPGQDPRFCLDLPWRPERTGCTVSRADTEAAFSKFDALAQNLAADVNGLFYARLRTGLCADASCGQRSPKGTPIWHDRSHITDRAAAELAPQLRAELDRQGFDD